MICGIHVSLISVLCCHITIGLSIIHIYLLFILDMIFVFDNKYYGGEKLASCCVYVKYDRSGRSILDISTSIHEVNVHTFNIASHASKMI